MGVSENIKTICKKMCVLNFIIMESMVSQRKHERINFSGLDKIIINCISIYYTEFASVAFGCYLLYIV